jgi:SAM-dependent methyltransferase
MDPIRRFSSKAQVYARYRPDFSAQAIAALKDATRLSLEARVIDIGAGTGMLTQHLLAHFATVYALEPNSEMRTIAGAEFGDLTGFGPLGAQAETIPLAANSIDLITAGRVMHWLQPEPTRAEFQRIAKPDAWLAIVRLNMIDDAFLQAMRELRTPENGFRTRSEDPHPGDVPVEFYFADGRYQTLTFLHTHQQTFEAFVGGLQSGSYAPDSDHPRFDNFLHAARDFFEALSEGDTMTLQVSTEILFGKL